jgi:lipopolysaccharide export LptBFGC system permease protein LptF
MKILDRYTFGLYASAFGIFLGAFLALYLLLDLVGRVDDFIDLPIGNRLLFAVEYYAVRLPLFLTILLPMVTLFAAMFTCHRLAKANELLPMVAAGMSLRRVTAPFFAAGALVAAANAGLEEWALPSFGTWIVHTENVLRRGNQDRNVFVRDADGNTYYFTNYQYSTLEGRRAFAAFFGPDRKIERLITAERVVCEAPPDPDRPRTAAWRFFGGVLTRYRPNLERDEGVPIPPEGIRLETSLDPNNLGRGEKLGTTFLTFEQILSLIQDNPQAPVFAVRMHSRLAAPLAPLILLLLGIPFVAVTQRQNLFVGVGACVLISTGYYVLQFVCTDGGVRGEMSPALAGWLPPLLFGTGGSALFFRRMKT